MHSQHAATPERRLQNFVAPRQGPGVRSGGLCSRIRTSSFDHDDGLVQRNFARRRKERARIADRLHVHDDALRPGIISQVVDQVAPVDIEHRSHRNERTEPDHLLLRPVQNRRTQGPALADEAHIARPRDR